MRNSNSSIRFILPLLFAVIAFLLMLRAGTGFKHLPSAGGEEPGVTVPEKTTPAYDPADLSRYNAEIEQVLVAYQEDVDRAAKAFGKDLERGRRGFAAVRASIPGAVKPYRSFKKVAKVIKAVAQDKIQKTNRTEELVRKDFMGPVFEPAMAAAGECDLAETRLRSELETARAKAAKRLVLAARALPGLPSAEPIEATMGRRAEIVADACAQSLALVAGAGVSAGVASALELIFIRETAQAIVRICARAAAKAGFSVAAPAADGPAPFLDVLAVGGLAWTAYDIHRLKRKMPKQLEEGITATVDQMEADALSNVKARARAIIKAYSAEASAMRSAAKSVVNVEG